MAKAPDKSKRSFAPKKFAIVPKRAFQDKRLGPRHFRVFGAICGAVDNKTGISLISQRRISQNGNLARQKVGKAINDLSEWGYLTPILRGRRKSGAQFLTNQYKIIFEPKDEGGRHVTPAGATAGVTPAGERSMSPSEVAESNPLSSKLSSSSTRQSHAEASSQGMLGAATTRRGHGVGISPHRLRHGRTATGTDANDSERLEAIRLKEAERIALEFESEASHAGIIGVDLKVLKSAKQQIQDATKDWSFAKRVQFDLKVQQEIKGLSHDDALERMRIRYTETAYRPSSDEHSLSGNSVSAIE